MTDDLPRIDYTYLAESFAQLKRTAHTLDDVKQWMMANPEALLGEEAIPLKNRCEVSLVLDMNLLTASFKTEALGASMRARLSPSFAAHPMLKESLGLDFTAEKTELALASPLQFKLKDWHFATAILVSRFLSTQSARRTAKRSMASWVVEKEQLLDAMLAIHFPGMKMDHLFSLVQNDLLSFVSRTDGTCGHSQVIDHLYTARRQTTSVTLPQELL